MSEKDERDEVVSMIRACLLSFKGEVSVKNLDTDYYTMVGKHIPYKALGYSSLLSFIESVNEIVTTVDSFGGETMVTAAATSSTKHIARMVAKQKGPKKFTPRFVNTERRSASTWQEPARSNGWYGSSSSRPPVAKPANSKYLGRNYDPNYRWKPSGTTSSPAYSDAKATTSSYEVPPRFKARSPSPTGSVWDDEESVPAVLKENNDTAKQSVEDIPALPKTPAVSEVAKRESPTPPAVVEKTPPPLGMMGLTPIQLRLQALQHQIQTEAEMKSREEAFLHSPEAPVMSPYLGTGTAETNAAQSDATFPNSHLLGTTYCLLQRYCGLKGLPPPQVAIEAHTSGFGYIGTLKVGIFSFASTYYEAQPARACVESMSQEAHHVLVKLNLPKEADYERPQHQISRLLKLIYQYETGIWSTYLEKIYTDFYKEALPAKWIEMLCEATSNLAIDVVAKTLSYDAILKPKILSSVRRLESLMLAAPNPASLIHLNLMRPIVNVPNSTYSHLLPVRPMFRQPVYNPAAVVTSPVNDFNPLLLGRPRARTSTASQPASPTDLEVSAKPVSRAGAFIDERPAFPKGSVWDVVITNVFATDEVWVRLAGQEFITIYHDMCNNMDIHYLSDVTPPVPVVPVVGSCYAIQIESCWQRVKLLDIQPNGDANLFFVDQGDEEVYPFAMCRNLHPSFASVPAQAIRLVLAGLEEFGNDASHTGVLIDVLLGKILVANVYEQLKDRTVVTLYNTDSATDININFVLTERMSLESKPPKLPSEGQAQEVYISHIDRDGIVFVVVDCDSYKFLPLLMFQLVDQSAKLDRCKVTHSTSRSKVYLARLSNEEGFYRVVPLTQTHNGKVPVRFIDHGHTDTLDISCLYDLAELSDALSRLPAQAVKVSLHNLPKSSFTHRMAARLRELIPEDLLVLLKVIKQAEAGGGTEVEIFKRIQPDNMLVSVNNTLALDPELKRTSSPEPASAFAAVRPRKRTTLPAPSVADIRVLLEALESGELDAALTDANEGQFPPSPRRPPQPPRAPLATSEPSPLAARNETQPAVEDAVSPAAVDGVLSNAVAGSVAAPYRMCGLPPPIVPPVGSMFDVHVPIVSNPSNFFVQPCSDGSLLEQMMYQMQAAYGGLAPTAAQRPLAPQDIVVGGAYAGLHSDGNWYRVTARSTAQSMTVLVSFSDFGDLSVLHLVNMRFLEEVFQSLSCQAINARIWGIKPSHQDWAVIDCIHFQKLVGERDFVSVVMEKSHAPDNPDEIIIGLRLIDTSGETDVYVDQLLVDEQKAVFIHDTLKEGSKTTVDMTKE